MIIANKGQNGPERWGQDIYGAYILPASLKPYGFDTDNVNPAPTTCVTGAETSGLGCAYPYIYDLIVVAPTSASSNPLVITCTHNPLQVGDICSFSDGGSTAIAVGRCQQIAGESTAIQLNQSQEYYDIPPCAYQTSDSSACGYYGGDYNSSNFSNYDTSCTNATSSSNNNIYITSTDACTSCNLQQAVASCAALNTGLADCTAAPTPSICWRLPSVDELWTTKQSGKGGLSNITNYWTSTEVSTSSVRTYIPMFGFGTALPSNSAHVRCVRSSS